MRQALFGLCVALSAFPAGARADDKAIPLWQFPTGGNMPEGGITLAFGQIFGTAAYGGSGTCYPNTGCGTVYRLYPSAGGTWVPETLYNFQGGTDGEFPAVQLAVAHDGSLYGYTSDNSLGTVFQLTKPAQKGGIWGFHVIYTFHGGDDGTLQYVYAPLIAQGGRLYGIASGGPVHACGRIGCGSVFRLDPPAPGKTAWTKTTLYAFNGGADGGQPSWSAGFDAAGGLYVTTQWQRGVVARFTPPAHGYLPWTEQVIATFPTHADGRYPNNLVLAPDGTVYGNAYGGGDPVFALTPSGGVWTKRVIGYAAYHFYGPQSLARGPNGSLIGVTYGDQDLYFGNAFQLTPPAGGTGLWTYTKLWDFNRGPDQNPLNMLMGPNGNFYGVLSGGGYTNGTVFKLRPRGE